MKSKRLLISIGVPLLLLVGAHAAMNRAVVAAAPATPPVVNTVAIPAPEIAGPARLASQLAVTSPITGMAWLRQYGTERDEVPVVSAVDNVGNIYIGANHYENVPYRWPDAVITKFDRDGSQVLQIPWGLLGVYESISGLAVDSSQNIYAAGVAENALYNRNSAWVAKFDSVGIQQWVYEIGVDNNKDRVFGLALDSQNNIYVVGNTYGDLDGGGQGYYDAWIAKFSNIGSLLWLDQFGYPGEADDLTAFAVDNTDNVYLTGFTVGDVGGPPHELDEEVWIAYYNSAGVQLWYEQFGDGTSTYPFDAAVDNANNLHLIGQTGGSLGGTNNGAWDAWIAKYNPDGLRQWLRQVGSAGGDTATGVAVAESGNAYVVGQTTGDLFGQNAGGKDVWIAGYDPDGTMQWFDRFGSSENDYPFNAGLHDGPGAIVVDQAGRILLAGDTWGNLNGLNQGGTDIWQAGYSSSGNRLWLTQFGTDSYDNQTTIAVDSFSNFFLAGYTSGDLGGPNAGGADAWLAKFSPHNPQPLVFVPGMAGSYLVDLNPGLFVPEERWPGIGTLGTLHNKLSLYPEDTPSPDIIATDAIREACPILDDCKIYGPMLEALVQRGDYREFQLPGPQDYRSQEWTNEERRQGIAGLAEAGWCDPAAGQAAPSLFVFPYDWRKSNIANAQLLKKYIEHCVRKFHPNAEVDILAHSNGGLLARRYILDNPGQHHVDKLITYGSPWLGAPKMLYVLESGDMGLPPFVLRSTIKYIAGSFTGSHELLPSRAFHDLGGGPVVVEAGWDWNQNGDRFEEINSYFHLSAAINDRYGRQGFEPGTANAQFHVTAQDDWRLDASGVDYFHIYGRQSKNTTPSQLWASWFVACNTPLECIGRNLFKPGFAVRPGVGDGTVQRLSAARLGFDKANTDYNDPEARLFPFCSTDPAGDELVEHNGLNRNPAVQDQVLELLGVDPVPLETTTAPLTLQQQPPSDEPKITDEVLDTLAREGKARVMISLYNPAPRGASSTEIAEAVAQVQGAVLAKVSPADLDVSRQYSHIAVLAGMITPQGAAILQQQPLVRHIRLSKPLTFDLQRSVPAIGADIVHRDYKLKGNGVRVAILDSGVKRDHPDLQGTVVKEKCFTLEGNCPGGGAESDRADDIYGHGTLVASIIAGKQGVAPEAEIVAVRLGDILPGDTKPTFYDEDILGGLNWILREQEDLKVQVINMSLSTGLYPGTCDQQLPDFAETIGRLIEKGIVVIATTGNKGDKSQIGAPACISGVIGVGASKISNGRQTSIADFTNSNVRLDLVAPGVDITGAALDGGTRTGSGTSFAAPHVAGVAALMLQNNRCSNVDPKDIEWLLTDTGDPLTDTNGLRIPAINALAAVKRISNSNPNRADQLNAYLAAAEGGIGLQTASTANLPDYFITIIGGRSLMVQDQLGNSTALINGTLQLPVPGVDTYIIGEDAHMAIVPAGGTYTITFQTTGQPLAVEITAGTGDQVARAVRYQDLSLPGGVTALLTLSGTEVKALRYDADGDGAFETTVTPTVDVIGVEAQDVEPPVITINATEQDSSTLITLTATDSGSGLSGLYYSLDGIHFQPYTQPFSLSPGEASAIYAFADDNVANRGTQKFGLAQSRIYLPLIIK